MAEHHLASRILGLMTDGRRRYTVDVHTHLGLPRHRYASVSTILSRLRKQGVLESELAKEGRGPGRRYYWMAKDKP